MKHSSLDGHCADRPRFRNMYNEHCTTLSFTGNRIDHQPDDGGRRVSRMGRYGTEAGTRSNNRSGLIYIHTRGVGHRITYERSGA
jgi:Tfp pilus assembly protein PilX